MSLGTIPIIALILVLLAAIPTFPARGWGHAPCGNIGVILVVIPILALMGRI